MKRIAAVGLALALVMTAGCNTMGRQPRLEQAMISPEVLKPGDSAVITVHLKDKYDIVEEVNGVVLEDTRVTFRLRDDGEPPDAEADDGIWSLMVDVPFLAPPGEFTLEIAGYDSRGNIVLVRTPEGEGPLKQSCRVVVEYPQEEEPPVESPPQTQE